MHKVLFVTEKWCDFNPNLAWTNNFHNTFNTFSQFANGKYTFDSIHLDEASITYNTHIDNVLPEYCEKYGTDIVFFSLVNAPYDPSLNCYIKLKEMGIYIIVLWPDTSPGWGISSMERLNPYVDIHLSWDKVPEQDFQGNLVRKRFTNHLCLFTPQDETLYHPRDTKDIDVSFLGSIAKYRDRTAFCNWVQNNSLNIVLGGGQRVQKLTPESYASIIRRSKIGVNFSLSQTGVFHQAKGRIFEYMASETFLLESRNNAINDYFIDNQHYVSFTDFNDLVQKIDYYLKHEDERLAIAKAGHEHFLNNWTSNHYWTQLMEKVENA